MTAPLIKLDYLKSALCREELPTEVARFYIENLNKIEIKREGVKLDIEKITKYLNDIILYNGKIPISYQISKKGNDTRLYASQYGQQAMIREIRHSLFNNYYYDIDMVNSQPVLLYNLCLLNNYPCNTLKELVENREEFNKQVAENKDEAKKLIIPILNGSEYKGKIKKLKCLYLEIKNIGERIKTDYKTIYNKKYKHFEKEDPSELWNISGKVIHYLTTEIESYVLTLVYKWFINKGFNIGSVIFDGLMIKKDKDLNENILNELNIYLEQTTKYKNVAFIIKPMNEGYKHTEEDLKPYIIPTYIIENDASGALLILENLKNNIIKCNSNYYIREYENTNIYKLSSEKEVKLYIKSFILNMNILYKSDNPLNPPRQYSKVERNAESLLKCVLCSLPNNKNFENEKLYNLSKYKLCFKNGYYNIKNKTFNNYDEETYTINYIKYDYNENINKEKYDILINKVLKPIFTDDHIFECAINYFSRGLFGEYNEKTWALSPGVRNSGKSIITKLLINTFSEYVMTFKGDNLLSIDNDGENEKKLKFIIPLRYARLCLSNELRTLDNKGKIMKLSGSCIKSLSSGGDEQTARLLNQNEQKFKLQSRFILFMNDFPECDTPDTWDTAYIIPYNSEFKEELTKEEEESNKKNKSHIKFFKADNKINEIIEDPEIHQAFIKLIIASYTDKPIINKNNKQLKTDYIEDKNNFKNIFESLFIKTNNEKDYILISEFNDIIGQKGNFTKSKLIQELGKLCISGIVKKIKGKCYRVYSGIKKIEDNEQNEEIPKEEEPKQEPEKLPKLFKIKKNKKEPEPKEPEQKEEPEKLPKLFKIYQDRRNRKFKLKKKQEEDDDLTIEDL